MPPAEVIFSFGMVFLKFPGENGAQHATEMQTGTNRDSLG